MHIFPAINSRRVFLFFILTGLILTVVFGWTTRQHASSAAATPPRSADDGGVRPAGNTITVNSLSDVANASDGLCTLREAITAANSNAGSGSVAGECAAGDSASPDLINIIVTGTINLT